MKITITSVPLVFVHLVCFAPGICVLADDATITGGSWSDWVQESSSDAIEFSVPTGTVMTGRQHTGDENGDTRYHYSRIEFQGQAVVPASGSWSEERAQHEVEYTCPADQVMTGRSHEGDEQGPTKFRCASLESPGLLENEWSGVIGVGDPQLSNSIQESSGTAFTCPPDRVLIGMKHEGDENGDTQYTCAPIVLTGVQGGGDCAITGQPKGDWVFHDYTNGANEIMYETGITRSSEFQNSKTEDWEASVTASVSAGFSFASASLQVSEVYADRVTSSVSKAVSQTEVQRNTKTFLDGGLVWQFVFYLSDECASDWQLKTSILVITENQEEKPCCLPGYAPVSQVQHGPCINKSPCACDVETCAGTGGHDQDQPSTETPTHVPPETPSQAFSSAEVTLALAIPAIIGCFD